LTLDAGLSLVHDVQIAHRNRDKCAALLFDITGSFDNVNKERLVLSMLQNLGFDGTVCKWARSFLTERKVTLSLNMTKSEERSQLPVGTLQGSPVSPVLSALYTLPLLNKPGEWNNSSLGMYVDDGVIFAHGPDWETVNRLLKARYQVCEDWLRRAGIAIEPDKTELIYFRRPWARNELTPTRLYLADPPNSTYTALPKPTVRYLGFFQKNMECVTALSNTRHRVSNLVGIEPVGKKFKVTD
jgi:hypothetical protein